MEFANPRHRETHGKVREYLDELFENPMEDEGHFYVRYGSTVLEISVEEYGEEEATVVIMAYCVQGADVDEELQAALLELNHTMSFGAFSLVGTDIFIAHTLFARTLERSNLLGAVEAVAEASDQYDDKICKRWGGERALDRIRGTGGRRRRRASARGSDS